MLIPLSSSLGWSNRLPRWKTASLNSASISLMDPNYRKRPKPCRGGRPAGDLLCDCVEAHGGPRSGTWGADVMFIYKRRTGWSG